MYQVFTFCLKIYLFWLCLSWTTTNMSFKGVCCFFVGASQLCDTLWKYFLPVLGSGADSSKGYQGRQHFRYRAWWPRSQEVSSKARWDYFRTLWCVSVIYLLFMETRHSLELSRNLIITYFLSNLLNVRSIRKYEDLLLKRSWRVFFKWHFKWISKHNH